MSLVRPTRLPNMLYPWLILITLLTGQTVSAQEPLLVVVNPATGITELSKTKLVNLYMGRDRHLDQQILALPLDIQGNHPAKAEFYRRLINRDIAEVNAYWVRVMFSGQASPPPEMDSFAAIAKLIKDNLGTIAYVPETILAQWPVEDYRVVYRLEP